MRALIIVVLVVLLPLGGALAAGRDVSRVFRFPPPLDIPTDFPRFSWIAAALVLLPLAAFASRFFATSRSAIRTPQSAIEFANARRRFPSWGAAAAGWTAAWWVLAWTRFPWFEPLQPYTFFPLWLGFIATVNALVYRRDGRCLMTESPVRWSGLFAVSAVFWWLFEWLNRFAENWHYLGAERFSAAGYAAHATVCFSTVLPAVQAVRDLLEPALAARGRNGPRWTLLHRRGAGFVLAALGCLALAGTGAYPPWLYPALWAAPLLLICGTAIATGRRGPWTDIAGGDWSGLLPWMVASLVCGFFWEMWNYLSLPKWIYTVPYCDRWHLFEMPALGYTGYLPFGAECAVAATLVTSSRPAEPTG